MWCLSGSGHSIGSGTPDQLAFSLANYCNRIYYVQTPIAYRGDTESAFAYPFIDTRGTAATTDDEPKFFIPSSSAGLVFSAAQALAGTGGSRAALQIMNIGTQMSVGDSGRVFTVEDLEPVATLAGRILGASASWAAVPGTILHFDHLVVEPTFRVGGNHVNQQPYPFEILSLPTRAPLAPVSLPGKSVVDLSISGTGQNPFLFGTQAIVGSNAVPAGFEFGDIVILFSADGRLDSIIVDQVAPSGGAIVPTRIVPSSNVTFNVGYIDGLVDNIDDLARFPEHVPGTVYPISAVDPPLATPGPPNPLDLKRVQPNFANSDCSWVGIQALSGAIQLESVAGQPELADLVSFYGLATSPSSRFVAARSVASI